MGHRRIVTEVDVYSCEHCGWVGSDPNTKKVQSLEPQEMGRLALGSRAGRAYLRYDCPLCKTPIRPSPPIELLRVASIDELANNSNGSSRRHTPEPLPTGSLPASSPELDSKED